MNARVGVGNLCTCRGDEPLEVGGWLEVFGTVRSVARGFFILAFEVLCGDEVGLDHSVRECVKRESVKKKVLKHDGFDMCWPGWQRSAILPLLFGVQCCHWSTSAILAVFVKSNDQELAPPLYNKSSCQLIFVDVSVLMLPSSEL